MPVLNVESLKDFGFGLNLGKLSIKKVTDTALYVLKKQWQKLRLCQSESRYDMPSLYYLVYYYKE